MENNLYYAPTIEEFYVGFEYEIKIKDNWRKKSTTISDFSPISDYDGMSILEEDLISNIIRVKTLDQSDIESLRLNGLEITEYVEESHLEFTWFKGIELFGLLTFTDKMISFYEYNYCIFRGTIKNKSELIKLMQQLNIK
mgnify:CR=1 FL=1